MMRRRWIWTALLLTSAARAADPMDVAVPSPWKGDPLILQGDYSPARSAGAPVLVCIHGLGSARGEWGPLRDRAIERGWGVAAYDLRGHGGSRATLSGRPVDHGDRAVARNPAFWKAMPADLEKVLEHVSGPLGVARARVALVGASLGANIALTVAVNRPGLGAVVLLSPGLDYAGIGTEALAPRLGTPGLLIAARPDVYSFTSAERLAASAPKGRVRWWSLPAGTSRGVHGAQLFDGKLEGRILDWVAGAVAAGAAQEGGASKR